MMQAYLSTPRSHRGRLTKGQASALDLYWSTFGLHSGDGVLDTVQLFGRHAPLVVEIGFGMGEGLVAQALAHPGVNFIGIDVYRPGIGALLSALQRQGINNVRIYAKDAITVLKQAIAPGSVHKLNIFFPDPWPKKRHYKRRLIQVEFVNLVGQKLQQRGVLHLATDWPHYANHIIEIVSSVNGFKRIWHYDRRHPLFIARPTTKFHRRALRLHHPIFDLVWTYAKSDLLC